MKTVVVRSVKGQRGRGTGGVGGIAQAVPEELNASTATMPNSAGTSGHGCCATVRTFCAAFSSTPSSPRADAAKAEETQRRLADRQPSRKLISTPPRPTDREMRDAYSTRVSMSRPSSSVPSR